MSEELVYLDSSAIVKLILSEAESEALRAFLRDRPFRVSSRLAEVEVLRAVRRYSADQAVAERSQAVLSGIRLLNIDTIVLSQAASLNPVGLRALDAIHLSSALFLRSALGGFIVYDRLLTAAARDAGLRVYAPE